MCGCYSSPTRYAVEINSHNALLQHVNLNFPSRIFVPLLFSVFLRINFPFRMRMLNAKFCSTKILLGGGNFRRRQIKFLSLFTTLHGDCLCKRWKTFLTYIIGWRQALKRFLCAFKILHRQRREKGFLEENFERFLRKLWAWGLGTCFQGSSVFLRELKFNGFYDWFKEKINESEVQQFALKLIFWYIQNNKIDLKRFKISKYFKIQLSVQI